MLLFNRQDVQNFSLLYDLWNVNHLQKCLIWFFPGIEPRTYLTTKPVVFISSYINSNYNKFEYVKLETVWLILDDLSMLRWVHSRSEVGIQVRRESRLPSGGMSQADLVSNTTFAFRILNTFLRTHIPCFQFSMKTRVWLFAFVLSTSLSNT